MKDTSQASSPRVSPYCENLCSKKILMNSGLPMKRSDVVDGSNWVWCARTELAMGPDSGSVGPEECQKGRDCFSSPFEGLL